MPEAIIVSALRTPIGTSFRGSLADTLPEEMARIVVSASVARLGVDPALFDDVVLAESNYGGGDVARHAAIESGLVHVPGQAVNRHCAGSLTAVQVAAGSIRAGMDELVIAGGVQSSSLNPAQRRRVPGTTDEWVENWASPSHPDSPVAPNRDMSITVGWNTAAEAGVSRAEMDAWALRSHQRAVAAIDAGAFDAEIVPVHALQKDGGYLDFRVDEHPRRNTSLERLAALKPLHPEIEGFSITAGNASGVNDAAAAVTVASERLVRAEGIESLGKVRAWANVGVDPARTGMAVPDAIALVLRRAGLAVHDISLWEINEAFASVPVAACRSLGIDEERVNTRGSGCSLGHPVAASGARMIATLVHQLRGAGGGLGLAAMCAGGGQAGAIIIEVA
jgi:acetyl-CoA acetyltransferase family protein